MKLDLNLIFSIFLWFINLELIFSYLFPYEVRNPLKGTPPLPGTIWPRPNHQNFSPKYFKVNNQLQIIFVAPQFNLTVGEHIVINCPILNWASSHYQNLIRQLETGPEVKNTSRNFGDTINHLRIELKSCDDGYPTLDTESTSEFYKLTIKKENHVMARLQANEPWGVIRGLESFYQLIWSPREDDDGFGETFINETEVTDWPRFPHRGLMIDTGRHYLPEVTIVQILTAMMYNKMNVLHFHIVDDQSWPFVSQTFPELSAKGAYSKEAIYTPDAIKRIIEAARVRAIRVLFEFDTPGHVGALGKSHKELLTPCYGNGTPGTANYPFHAAYENLDPTNEKVYQFMREFYTEIVGNVSRDPCLHLGLDEVYAPCWESSPVIHDFMTEKGYTEIGEVQEYYMKRLVEIVQELNVTPIAWQDPLMAGAELDKTVVIQVWQDWAGNKWETFWKKALKNGYKLILSACWYINYIGYGESWRNYYLCDPILSANVSPSEESQILGGEAAIWGEFVDGTNIIPRLFPFTSAVAEVLWTNRTAIENLDNVMWRLDQFRCSLLRRGIQAQPILNSHCGSFEANL